MIKLRLTERLLTEQNSPMYSADVCFCPERTGTPRFCD